MIRWLMNLVHNLYEHKILTAFLLTILVSIIHFITHLLQIHYNLISFTYAMSASFYGSLLFPIYYVITFLCFFTCLNFIESRGRYIVWVIIGFYLLLSLPIIDLDTLKFNY